MDNPTGLNNNLEQNSRENHFTYAIRIPMERVAVLIGAKGETKKQIEQETHSTLSIDSKEGEVTVIGHDPLMLFATKSIITAIGRGFNPDIALQLLKPDYLFEMIHIMDYVKSKQGMARVKGRVIGKAGKVREVIEELTETNITVYGKTIGIIGQVNNVGLARRAIELLLQGSMHRSVYSWLERRKKKIMAQGDDDMSAFKGDFEAVEGFEEDN